MDNQKIILNVENLNTTFVSDKKEIKIVKKCFLSGKTRKNTCCCRRIRMRKECDHEFHHAFYRKKCNRKSRQYSV